MKREAVRRRAQGAFDESLQDSPRAQTSWREWALQEQRSHASKERYADSLQSRQRPPLVMTNNGTKTRTQFSNYAVQ